MSQPFKLGDLVRKRLGYQYPGVIVSVFATRAVRCVMSLRPITPHLPECFIFLTETADLAAARRDAFRGSAPSRP